MSINPCPPDRVDVDVDARELKCPEPLMLVRNKMMDMDSGQVIKILATDPSTSWDFPNFCKFLGHQMLHSDTVGGEYQYWIRKK
jgi:tRNA 2-thiouridine synthesizing protein A